MQHWDIYKVYRAYIVQTTSQKTMQRKIRPAAQCIETKDNVIVNKQSTTLP